MNENQFAHQYSFIYKHSCGDESAVTHIRPDAETWHEVLDKFVSFLSQIYGYDISQYITVDGPMTFDELMKERGFDPNENY